ncbi:PAS/PAC sensor hybrid histidine kinase [Cystobacter fuscus DSM 2262]|uniref:histidine kinase n=1 Tax=Cystobacter fuscus (strain ATCC 25194 / DSM 2262 / NBRC 100088 / M29) TaxID=1242864 RepID=S9QID1_CYSF2|nr:PAS domain-containing sensor histidine kinase [Cystobacter fuscus]EPX56213.1 PAS/PAC sensor hybrid histidine kinase [Cystobacter fuscus DSM 2262]
MRDQGSSVVVELSALQEERARMILDNIEDYAVFMLDPTGHVKTWNKGAERINGYTLGEIQGRHFSLFYPPADIVAGKCERELRCATAEGRFEEEGWRIRKNGDQYWASVIITPMRDPTGKLVGFAKITRDLTERRKAEEQIRQSEERFRLLVTSIKDYAVFMLEPDGRVNSWNPGAQRLKGYQAQEIIGQPISRFYMEEEVARGKPWDLLREAAEQGRVEDEGWRVRKDGSLFWANVIITAVRDEEGRLRGFAKITRDLTERRKNEDLLRRSEERFRLLVSSVKDYAIFMLDPHGRVMTWNDGAAHLKGYSAREIVGEHFSRFYPPEDLAVNKPALQLEAAERDGRVEDESWRVRKDGSLFWASVTLTAMRDAKGLLLGFSKVTRDLTEHKRTQEERLQLAQSQEAIRLRDEFLSIAAHELKTPVTALQLQLQGLKRDMTSLEPKHEARLERVLRSTGRLSHLVETLLDVSRISTGRLTLHPERIDLVATVKDLTERLRDAAVSADCQLLVQEAQPIEGTWDRLRIEQVVTNLLSNSFKYAAGHPIEISMAREGAEVILVITDKGPGLPEKDMPRLFGRFERAAPMSHYGGLGLGLYVSREIVEAHGGIISADNLPEGGARFTIRMPTDLLAPGAAPDEPREPGPRRSG